MKKILLILMALFFVLPITNALAHDDGYLGANPQYATNGVMIDNDLNTSYGFITEQFLTKDLPFLNINSVFLSLDNNYGAVVHFYGAGNIFLGSVSVSDPLGFKNFPEVKGVQRIKVTVPNGQNRRVREFDFKVAKEIIIDVKPILNLTENHTYKSIDLTWENPVSDFIESIIVKSNGIEVATLTNTKKAYSFTNLSPETLYNLEVVVKYLNGKSSESTSIKVTTDKAPPPPEPVGDISKLKADAEYDRVDLSWTLPASENFKHVNIYRDTLDKSLLDKLLGVRTVKAATPIFETNGTYFNDLTVQSETKYEYLLTTTSKEGLESVGVSTTVTTPKKPEPEIEGGGYEKDPETGDFTYTWTKPTTGKVKVMIDGKLHATVEGATGKIIIPAADMKYTLFGKPDVQLIPVDEDGAEGKPVKPPSGGGSGGSENGGNDAVEMPFSVIELLKTTFDFIKLVGPFILLFLIIYLTPQIIKVIRMAILRRGIGGKGNDE